PPRTAYRIHLARAECASAMGHLMLQVRETRRARDLARQSGLAAETLRANLALGFALYLIGAREKGRRLLFRTSVLASRVRLVDLATEAYSDIAATEWTFGHYRLALNYQKRLLCLIRKQHDSALLARCMMNTAVILTDLGIYERAKCYLEELMHPNSQIDSTTPTISVLIDMGEVYRCRGSWRIAKEHN